MDALVLTSTKKLSVSAIAQMLEVFKNRISGAINVNVAWAHQAQTYGEVNALDVDEKSLSRRMSYLTLFHDPSMDSAESH